MPKFELKDILVVDDQCKIKIFYKLLHMVVVNSKPFCIHFFTRANEYVCILAHAHTWLYTLEEMKGKR